MLVLDVEHNLMQFLGGTPLYTPVLQVHGNPSGQRELVTVLAQLHTLCNAKICMQIEVHLSHVQM